MRPVLHRLAATLIWGAVVVLHQPAAARTFPLMSGDSTVIGRLVTMAARHEDTLSDIAREHQVGYGQIIAANAGVDPWLPGAGTPIVLPTQHVLPDAPHQGLVLNLPEFRLYYYQAAGRSERPRVSTYPVGIGDIDTRTPPGLTRVVAKLVNPSWYPPASIRAERERNGESLPAVVPPGPENPLGAFALRLAMPGYLIHGTNKPYGIGMRVSHGCVRLYPEHVAQLFRELPVGAPVRIIDQPVKAGWLDGTLYLEAHRPLEGSRAEAGITAAVRAVIAATARRKARIDWHAVESAVLERRGVPVAISR